MAAFAGAAGGGGRRHRRVVAARPAGARGRHRRSDPAGRAGTDAARPGADRRPGARRFGHRADELHRDDRGRPRVRHVFGSADQRQPRTGRHRRGQHRRRAARRHAGRRRHLAIGGGEIRGRALSEGLARDRRGRAGDDAAARAGARAAAERGAGGDRHRLFGRADPAGRVPRHPPRAHDGVSLGAGRLRRRAGVRHAEGHRRRDHRVDDRAGQPGRESSRVGHRPQARRRRAAAVVGRTPRR